MKARLEVRLTSKVRKVRDQSNGESDPYATRTRLAWAINGPLKPVVNKDLGLSTFGEETASVGTLDSS